MSQRRLLQLAPLLGTIPIAFKSKNQTPGHQKSEFVRAKSADLAKIENLTSHKDLSIDKSGQLLF